MTPYRLTPLRALAVLASGLAAGWGLSLATMVQPRVVLSFLRLHDWGLMLVMGGALAVVLLAYQQVPRRMSAPLLGGRFEAPGNDFDRNTIVGAAIFGIGWGLCGVCPGPAIAGLVAGIGSGQPDLLWALAGILAGALLQGWTAAAPAPASAATAAGRSAN